MYKKSILQALDALGCSYVFLEKFFVGKELAISRLASDIFIHAPVSDALSGTMLELLYGSNIVFTGSWLPYKTFKNAYLNYYEINNLEELPEKMDTVIENITSEKERTIINKSFIRDAFISEKMIKNWAQILN